MRLLSLIFDHPLNRRNIAGFRASVARAAGYEQDLLHNHREDGSVQYRYPLVQYRTEAGRAALIGLDEGTTAIFDWYSQSNCRLFWNEAQHNLPIYGMSMEQYDIAYHDQSHTYRLTQWLALNERNYRDWQQMATLTDRIAELERVLVAHLLTFCRAVGWRLPQRLEVSLELLHATRRTRFLGVNVVGFNINFRSNLVLPYGIGLGKGVSHGFGVCRPMAHRRTNQSAAEK